MELLTLATLVLPLVALLALRIVVPAFLKVTVAAVGGPEAVGTALTVPVKVTAEPKAALVVDRLNVVMVALSTVCPPLSVPVDVPRVTLPL